MKIDQKFKILIADSHPIVKSGMENLLRESQLFSIIGYARNSTELFRLLEASEIDVLITEYVLPNGDFQDGESMLRRVIRLYPLLKIIVITALSDPAIIKTIYHMKINGLMTKNSEPEEILISVRNVVCGGKYVGKNLKDIFSEENGFRASGIELLSPREGEILRMFLSGMAIKDIANKTHRSIKTVSNQKQSAFRKLGCRTNAEMFRLKFMTGYIKSNEILLDNFSPGEDVARPDSLH